MAKKKSRKQEAGGLWYFAYLRPVWHIEFDTKLQTGMQAIFWNNTMVPMLAAHYKLNKATQDQLRSLPLSQGSAFIDGDDAYVWITGGFPQRELLFDPLNQIVSALGLTRHLFKQRVQVKEIPLDYETQEMHRSQLQKIIGKVPY